MSAPDTNTQKQAEKHRGPLTGMMAVVLFALVLLAVTGIVLVNRGGAPEGAAAQVDGRTGEVDAAGGADPAPSATGDSLEDATGTATATGQGTTQAVTDADPGPTGGIAPTGGGGTTGQPGATPTGGTEEGGSVETRGTGTATPPGAGTGAGTVDGGAATTGAATGGGPATGTGTGN